MRGMQLWSRTGLCSALDSIQAHESWFTLRFIPFCMLLILWTTKKLRSLCIPFCDP